MTLKDRAIREILTTPDPDLDLRVVRLLTRELIAAVEERDRVIAQATASLATDLLYPSLEPEVPR